MKKLLCVCMCFSVCVCVGVWLCMCVCVLKMHTKRCSVKRVQKLEAELNKLESEAELSGLKINFAKSRFGAFGISDQWKHDAAKYLNCSCLTLLFVYLGIPIGAINATKW